jgi:hypothetical protein
MPICVEKAPPLFRTDQYRANSCYLYREAPVLPAGQMDEVFAEAAPVSSS